MSSWSVNSTPHVHQGYLDPHNASHRALEQKRRGAFLIWL